MTSYATSPSIHLPRGEYASFEEMQSYGRVLQSFIHSQEALLQDLEDVQQHNDTIDYLHSLANSYNEQLRVYKEAESRRQRDVWSSLLQVMGN